MLRQKISLRIIFRYSLIQIPGIVTLLGMLFLVRQWVDLPGWTLWLILSIWVLKDIILFFFTWRAYDREHRESIIGKHGIVLDRLDPEGYILVHGEQWRAEVKDEDQPIEKGQKVLIYDRKGLKLLVKPVEN